MPHLNKTKTFFVNATLQILTEFFWSNSREFSDSGLTCVQSGSSTARNQGHLGRPSHIVAVYPGSEGRLPHTCCVCTLNFSNLNCVFSGVGLFDRDVGLGPGNSNETLGTPVDGGRTIAFSGHDGQPQSCGDGEPEDSFVTVIGTIATFAAQ